MKIINLFNELLHAFENDFSRFNLESRRNQIDNINWIEEIEMIGKFLKGSVLHRTFIYEIISCSSKIPNSLLEMFCESTLGIHTSYRLMDQTFFSLVRLFGFTNVLNTYLNIYQESKLVLIKYYALECLRHIDFQDLVSYNNEKLIIDAKACYEWKDKYYIVKRELFNSDAEKKVYQSNIESALFRKYEVAIEAFIAWDKYIPIREVSRFLFPRKEYCPKHLLSSYEKALMLE